MEVLIQQIVEFELWGLGPSSRTCTLTSDYFHDKTKILKANFRVIIIYCQNIAGGNVPYFPLPGPSHLQTLTPKYKNLNMLWIKL